MSIMNCCEAAKALKKWLQFALVVTWLLFVGIGTFAIFALGSIMSAMTALSLNAGFLVSLTLVAGTITALVLSIRKAQRELDQVNVLIGKQCLHDGKDPLGEPLKDAPAPKPVPPVPTAKKSKAFLITLLLVMGVIAAVAISKQDPRPRTVRNCIASVMGNAPDCAPSDGGECLPTMINGRPPECGSYSGDPSDCADSDIPASYGTHYRYCYSVTGDGQCIPCQYGDH